MRNIGTERSCSRCLMDESARPISFNEFGYCTYCVEFLEAYGTERSGTSANPEALSKLLNNIVSDGVGNRYDCIVGVSGGIDSSYVLVKAVELGLRPLAVHMDNAWNSELAQSNISRLIRKLDVDLETHVIRWPEYRDLMKAFLAADVVDLELLYDNAMLGTNYALARKHRIHYILAGTNRATEGIRMPESWNWYKSDKRNIRSIARAANVRKFESYPFSSTLDRLRGQYLDRINWVSFLDLTGYSKDEALGVLVQDYGYQPYPYKHYESILTRFYQGYLLPTKFGIDKRRLHLSNLIVTGQMTRDEGLGLLDSNAYPDDADLRRDYRYFIKKMGWSEVDLQEYIARPPRPHTDFASEVWIINLLNRVKTFARAIARR